MSEETVETEDPEIQELRAKLQKLVQNNIEIENDLIQSGVRPNAFVIASLRLDLLLDMIMSPVERYNFEIESAKRVHGVLMHIQADMQKQQSQQKLLLPDPKIQAPPPGIIQK